MTARLIIEIRMKNDHCIYKSLKLKIVIIYTIDNYN